MFQGVRFNSLTQFGESQRNIFQQLTGIDFVLYFAPLLFLQAGLTAQSASFFASGVTGILLVAATVTGTLYIDKIGRRRLFIVGGVIIVICHFTLGTMYLTRASETAVGKWVCIVFIEIFAVGFAGTWSLVIRLYATEIQPNRTRASASSFGQGSSGSQSTAPISLNCYEPF
jgi:MFS family permease